MLESLGKQNFSTVTLKGNTMAIVQSINHVSQFIEAFRLAGRGDQFSYEGLEVLFDYLEQLSEDTGEPIELDVVGLCCDYYESSIEELIEQYSIDVSDADGDEDTIAEIVKEYLSDNTAYVGETEGCLIYAAF